MIVKRMCKGMGLLSLTLALAVVVLCSNVNATTTTAPTSAPASVFDAMWNGEPIWTQFGNSDGGTTPGAGGQNFDAEYLYYTLDGTSLSIGLQTGFNLDDGKLSVTDSYGTINYSAGDLKLSFDGLDAVSGNNHGYEYAVDFGFETIDYDNDLVGGNNQDGASDHSGTDAEGVYLVSDWNNDVVRPGSGYYSGSEDFTSAGPFAMEEGNRIAELSENYFGTTTSANGSESFYRIVTFDLDDLGIALPMTMDAAWTMSCGNDVVDGNFEIGGSGNNVDRVPEPSTIALLGLGLTGLGCRYLRRKRLQRNNC